MTEKYLRCYKHAFKGLGRIIFRERNIKIHLLIVAIVLPLLIFYFKFSAVELAIVLTFMGLVIIAEIINTLIEKILDHLHPESHEMVALIKDGGAGAVLAAAILSIIIGLILIFPHLVASLDWLIAGILALVVFFILYLGLSFWRK
jgi:diacylglycerol kinase